MNRLLLILTALFMFVANMSAQKLTIADVAGDKFSAKTVRGINPIEGTDTYARISDDGKRVECYSFKTGKRLSVMFDVDNTIGRKINDFDGYILSPDGTRMLIQTKTKRIYRRSFTAVYYIYNIASKKLETLSDGGPQQVPIWSADGLQVAFVREGNIFLVKLLYDNAEIQVTKDGSRGEVINGLPDWVNEEEFGFNRALTFNADGTMICWLRYDEAAVESYSLQMYKGLEPEKIANADYPGLYTYKYPKAGHANSTVSAWSYDIKSHKINRLQVPLDADGYMPRIKATNDPMRIIVYTMNRHQDQLCLYAANPRSTVAQLIVKEEVPKYVREEAMASTIIVGNEILLPSDRSGFTKLYMYNMNGQLLRTIGGDYDITSVYGCDARTGDIFFQAAALGATDRQIYVAHRNGKIQRLSDKEGWNTALFSADYQYFVNTWSDYNTPYVVTTRTRDGKVVSTLQDNAELKTLISQYGFCKRESFTFKTSEGVELNGWMLRPANFDASHKYPVIMHQYSGPGSQMVINAWHAGSMGNGGAFDSYLAQHGFIVVCVDGRGTGGRGSEFEKCTYLNIGALESKDQVETALYLGSLPYIDKDRIGIWGWSYGGFNTLMSMSEGRPVFKAGVAIAPPTNWKFYDTVYTERFMRTPKENPDGYADNPIERAPKLHGALLLCHGTADDNVHPQNTFEYSEALVQADKDFSELLYTNRNHSIFGANTRNHLLRQVANFFERELK